MSADELVRLFFYIWSASVISCVVGIWMGRRSK